MPQPPNLQKMLQQAQEMMAAQQEAQEALKNERVEASVLELDLDGILELAGTGVTVNSLHPGAVATDIWSGAPWYARPVLALAKRAMDSPADGGRHITYLAIDPEVEGETGGYYDDDRLKEPSDLARDGALAERLREVSAEIVGLG